MAALSGSAPESHPSERIARPCRTCPCGHVDSTTTIPCRDQAFRLRLFSCVRSMLETKERNTTPLTVLASRYSYTRGSSSTAPARLGRLFCLSSTERFEFRSGVARQKSLLRSPSTFARRAANCSYSTPSSNPLIKQVHPALQVKIGRHRKPGHWMSNRKSGHLMSNSTAVRVRRGARAIYQQLARVMQARALGSPMQAVKNGLAPATTTVEPPSENPFSPPSR